MNRRTTPRFKNTIPADGQALVYEKVSGSWKPGSPAAALADGAVTNAKVASGAAISWSKVSKSGAAASDVGAAASTHAHAQSDVTNLTTDLAGKEPTITAGTSGQYWRGDKTWQTLPSSASEIVGAAAPISAIAVNNAASQTLATKTITVSAGDQIHATVYGSFLNNSGGTVTPTVSFTLGNMTVNLADGTTSATNANNRSFWTISGTWSVYSTSSVIFGGEFYHGTAAAANTAMSTALANNRTIWQTSSSNLTGAVACTIGMKSSTVTATQTFTVHNWTIKKTGSV